jgi:hypothetical protein
MKATYKQTERTREVILNKLYTSEIKEFSKDKLPFIVTYCVEVHQVFKVGDLSVDPLLGESGCFQQLLGKD